MAGVAAMTGIVLTGAAVYAVFQVHWRFFGPLTPILVACLVAGAAAGFGISAGVMAIRRLRGSLPEPRKRSAVVILLTTLPATVLALGLFGYTALMLLLSTGGGMGH